MIKGFIAEGDLSLDDLIKIMIKPSCREGCGAIASYVGYVKAVIDGHKVNEVVLESNENAEEILTKIAREVGRKYKVHDIVIAHKEGSLKPGDTLMYVVVSACTRNDALRAVEEAVNRVKAEAPIRKIERREDGEYIVMSEGARRLISQQI